MRVVKKRAVALRYNDGSDAPPKLVAKGDGNMAERIREAASAAGVPIYEDDALVEVLAQIELDEEIPPELFQAVAEVLSWVYKANGSL